MQLGREALFAGAKKVGAFGAGAAVDDYLKTLMRRRLALCRAIGVDARSYLS